MSEDTSYALVIACPTCHAPVGERCKNHRGGHCAPHGERRYQAGRAARARVRAAAGPPGRMMCRCCGHRADQPERHMAIGNMECPGGVDEFMPAEELAR